ncbi:MAG: carbohydrate-binding protein [Cytophagaceae bacterium]
MNSNAQTIMFDDFTYSSVDDPQLSSFNRWSIVNGRSGPPEGAQYNRSNITFINDPSNPSNRLMTLSTTVNGSTKATTHSRIETAGYDYFEGTYAARVFFSDVPFTYKDGNVQTFYTIVSSSLAGDGSRYSEIDFEYLAADKWGIAPDRPVMYMTSWNRYIANPWQAWKRYFYSQRSWAGWHTCVFSCTDGVNVKFWIDGVYYGAMSRTDNDGTSVYPRNPMNISFANWIWNNVVGNSTDNRTTIMQVDWVLFQRNQELSPTQVDNLVASYRSQGLQRRNLAGQTFITSCNVPSQPGNITGNTTVAAGSSQTYSVAAVAGATSYTWTLPSGWSGNSTGTSITTTVGSAGGTISVRANNSCGTGAARSLMVNVTCNSPAQPGAISGNTNVNAGSTNTYSIAAVNGATSYTWILPSGWSGNSTGTSIVATAGTAGGTIRVTANNSCGSSTERLLNVNVIQNSNNLATGKPAYSSSNETSALISGLAVDGSMSTRWASAYSDPQWLYIDLGASFNISGVRIFWETALGRDYQIQVSSNASTWTTIRTVTSNTSLTNDLTGLSGTGRYIRIYGTARGTQWGYSIYELEVYGTPSTTPGFTLRIEAENYMHMSGVSTQACSEGGLNVSSFDAYDWMSYNVNIPASGTYRVSYRVASPNSNRSIRLERESGAILIGTINVPNTGAWQTWTTVSHDVYLPAGQYPIGLTTYNGGINLNWIEISSVGASAARIASVNNADTSTEVNLYPNPVTGGNVAVYVPAMEGKVNIQLLNSSGLPVKSLDAILSDNRLDLDVSGLREGFYFIRIDQDDKSVIKKFFIQ